MLWWDFKTSHNCISTFMGMHSFWNANPMAPSWISLAGHAWSGHPPKLLEIVHTQKEIYPPRGCIMRNMREADVPATVELWSRFFSKSPNCRCLVPRSHLVKMLAEKRWEGIVVINPAGEVVGTLIRRFIKNLHVDKATWKTAGAIDYFCVHPTWRKKGVGRALLTAIQNRTQEPFPPQLFFLEHFQMRIPPISAGVFMSLQSNRQMGQEAVRVHDAKHIWENCVKGSDVWSSEPGEEISFWKADERSGVVVIWNTFHRVMPGGELIGIVLSDNADAVEALASVKSPWGVFLAAGASSRGRAGWKINSVFQWIGYNLSIGFISGRFPVIGF
jgi:GNAT superfamily N-acetyltransferase